MPVVRRMFPEMVGILKTLNYKKSSFKVFLFFADADTETYIDTHVLVLLYRLHAV